MSEVTLITGSSKGIGFAIARTLQKENHSIILNARSEDDLSKASQELNHAPYILADVVNLTEIEKLVSYFKTNNLKLKNLVCNVGSGRSVPPGQESHDEWKRVFDINFFSATNVIEALRSYMIEDCSIVCISSICGIETIPGAPITYSVAKSALNTYVKSMSRPLGKGKIRINAVAPGNILFKGSVWDTKLNENPAQVQSMLDKEVPLTQLGQTDDIAHLVAFLCSSKAQFATGSIFTLDGGQTRSI